MSLKQISSILIRFNPLGKSTASVKEFVSRCNSPKARASNPECSVQTQLTTRREADPTVTVTYSNGAKETLVTATMTAQQITQAIKEKRELLESQELLKKNGVTENDKLVSDWGTPGCVQSKIWTSLEQ